MRERAKDAWLRLQAGDERLLLAVGTACSFVLNAAFPRLARKLRWRSRLSLRAHVVYVVVWLALGAALRAAALRLKAWTDGYDRRLYDFRRAHGREPTYHELLELVRAANPP